MVVSRTYESSPTRKGRVTPDFDSERRGPTHSIDFLWGSVVNTTLFVVGERTELVSDWS